MGFAVMAAASVSAVPITEVETSEEFEIIKESMANFGSWLKGKECRMQSCPETCDRKYRLAWGRRLLSGDDDVNALLSQESSNDDTETEAEIQTGSKAQWGGIKKAIKKVIPTKVYYDDCSRKNECLAKNTACKAKLDSLRATAAQKAKYADLKQKDADAAKALLDEAQSAVAAAAKDLADSKKHQDRIKSYQS